MNQNLQLYIIPIRRMIKKKNYDIILLLIYPLKIYDLVE